MVILVVAGLAAVKGGIAVKQKIETRKNPVLDGDFIVAPPSTTEKNRNSLANVRGSLSKIAQTVKESTKRLSSKTTRQAQTTTTTSTSTSTATSTSTSTTKTHQHTPSSQQGEALYQSGQQVRLKYMTDPRLNGCTALVLQDFHDSVLVQFLEQQSDYDNYYESGMQLSHEHVEPLRDSASSSCRSSSSSDSIVGNDDTMVQVNATLNENSPIETTSASVIPLGTMIELHNLSAAHMNGLRGMVVAPTSNFVLANGRVAVQLYRKYGDTMNVQQKLISVKTDNCRIIRY